MIDLNHGSGYNPSTDNVFRPSETQSRAIAEIKDWFLNKTDGQQVFRLFGYAGTGKSTVLKLVLDSLSLKHQMIVRAGDGEPAEGGVVTATFTGKAALVLRQKGTPARTIHSLIYSVIESTEAEIKQQEERIEALEAEQAVSTWDTIDRDAKIQAAKNTLSQMKKPRFALNPLSPAKFADLIVLDEVSMVGDEMAKDLLSFGRPVLVLGDPGQLPPIHGEGAFTKQEPDVMLTEIHRQAAESAIIRLATAARTQQPIACGSYSDSVAVLPKGMILAEQMLKARQVIVGKNATRRDLNNQLRRAAGFVNGALPTGPAEKIICLKNQNDIGLVNGGFVSLDNIKPDAKNDMAFSAEVTMLDLEEPGREGGKKRRLRIYAGHFLDHFQFDPERGERDWKMRKSLVEVTYGWAITCHKAQGSQWENVVVWDDGLGQTPLDRARWLYTAITRAETGLVLLQ